MDLSGKTVLVTGGSSGIGRAIVARAHASGARVFFMYFSWESRALEIERAHAGVRAVHCDLRAAEAIAEVVNLCVREGGGLHGLVNSAGIYREAHLDSKIFLSTLHDVLSINFLAAAEAMRAVVPVMRSAGGGSIVNISSIESGQTGKTGSIPYGVSKWALDALSVGAAVELAEAGIRVNAIAPGPILTEMWEGTEDAYMERFRAKVPLGRFGTPEEVADLAVFLLCDLSSYMTAQIVNVDGGILRKTM